MGEFAWKSPNVNIVLLSKVLYFALRSPVHTRALMVASTRERHRPGLQERFVVRCLAQGRFDMQTG